MTGKGENAIIVFKVIKIGQSIFPNVFIMIQQSTASYDISPVLFYLSNIHIGPLYASFCLCSV